MTYVGHLFVFGGTEENVEERKASNLLVNIYFTQYLLRSLSN
jgi:hypothetical protein